MPEATTDDRVGLGILPLRDLSPGRSFRHLAAGFTEDLQTELLRFPTLDVYPAGSLAENRPDADDVPLDVGRARTLGVSHVLRGSVRTDDTTLRVNLQLVELGRGRLSWAETFDAPLADLFLVQDEIVSRVAGALSLHLDDRRLARARRTPIGGLSTYECWLSGLECLQRGTLESDAEARSYFQRAIDLDPLYARAWAGLSLSYFNDWSCQVWHLFEENENEAFCNAQRAAEIDDSDAVVHLVLGRIQVFRREYEVGRRSLERALALHPNHPEILGHMGILWCNLGEPEKAVDAARRAQCLNPHPPPWYFLGEGMGLYLLSRFEDALAVAERAETVFVDAPALRAAAAAMLGDPDRAAHELQRFEQDFQLKIAYGRDPKPGEIVHWLDHVNPFMRPEDRALFIEGLERAGLDTERADGPGGAAKPSPTAPRLPMGGNLFRKEGETWNVAFDGEGAQLGELKGFHDLAMLLSRPDHEIHCLELRGLLELSGTQDPGDLPHDVAAADHVLDDRARSEIRSRIRELERAVEDADAQQDLGRAERARDELEALQAELSKALGVGGSPRRLGDPAEKARTAVTWRIRSAIKKVAVAHPRLGAHLQRAVKTGTFCSYSPEVPTEWLVD